MTNYEWQLDNWIRWCRRRDYLPQGHKSGLATLMRQAKQESLSATDAATPLYEQAALAFDALVMLLPARHRALFLLHHLDKAATSHRIVRATDMSRKLSLSQISQATFYRRVKEAETMLQGRLRVAA